MTLIQSDQSDEKSGIPILLCMYQRLYRPCSPTKNNGVFDLKQGSFRDG
jgi:hypothetical protein